MLYYILYLTTVCGEKCGHVGSFPLYSQQGFISQFTPFQKSHIKLEIKIRSSDTALVCLTLMQIKYPR